MINCEKYQNFQKKKKKYIKKIKFIVLDYKDSCIINSFVLFVTVNLLVKNLGRIVLFDLFFSNYIDLNSDLDFIWIGSFIARKTRR